MSQEITIVELKQELTEINREALAYFHCEAEFAKETGAGDDIYVMFPTLRQRQAHVTPQNPELGETIARRLAEAMGKLSIVAKRSPLLDEADQRDIAINTKVMRAALEFREYSHWDADVIHDEGTVPQPDSPTGKPVSPLLKSIFRRHTLP